MRTSIARPLVVSGLVGLAVLAGAGYRSALLAQGEPVRSAGAVSRVAPGFGGGFGSDKKAAPAKPVATIYLTSPMTGAAARTWMKLQEPITLPFANETPLEDAMKLIKETTAGKNDRGIQFYVDPVGLQEAEKTMTSPITLSLEDVPLSTALTLLLKQLGLTYSVQKDGIVIITDVSNENAFADPTAKILEEVTALRVELEEMRRQLGLRSPR